jgi:hypothetical protein
VALRFVAMRRSIAVGRATERKVQCAPLITIRVTVG